MHHQPRNNTRMRLIVEQGIAQDLRHGSVAAWRFLSSHGVPEDMILRVLSNPDQRRATDGAPHLHERPGSPPAQSPTV